MLEFSCVVVEVVLWCTMKHKQIVVIVSQEILLTPDFQSLFPSVIRAQQINQYAVDLNKVPLEELFADDFPCKSHTHCCHIPEKLLLFLQIKHSSYSWQVPVPACSWTGTGALLE